MQLRQSIGDLNRYQVSAFTHTPLISSGIRPDLLPQDVTGSRSEGERYGRAIWGSRTGLLDQRAFPRNAGGIHAAQSPGSVTRRNRMATTLDWQPDSLEGYQQQV